MQSFFIFVSLACALASTCIAENAAPACAPESAGDSDDDHCQLLQTGAKPIVIEHQQNQDKALPAERSAVLTDIKSSDEHHQAQDKALPAERTVVLADVKSSGSAAAKGEDIPGWMKGVANAVGGVGKLEKEFDGLKVAAVAFGTQVHTATATLTGSITTTMTIDRIVAAVETFDQACYAAALKLYNEISRVITEFMNGVNKIAPPKFKTALNTTLSKVRDEAHIFADSFKSAATNLRSVNRTMICQTVSHSLHSMHAKVNALITSATGMTAGKMNKELVAAKELLPTLIKTEVEQILKKATDAFQDLQSKLLPVLKEVLHGTSMAFKGHCTGLQGGAGRLQVGLFSALVVAIMAFFA